MLKKAEDFELTDLFAIATIIAILATLLIPNVVTTIQKSKQKTTLKNTIIISTGIIEKIKAGKRTFDKYTQGIMGVNKAEKELAKSTETFKERHPKLWRIKPWERNDSNFNNSGPKKKRSEYRRF